MVLNPILYRLLDERLGPVKVVNENVEKQGYYGNDVKGNPKLFLEAWGELYRVSCPFCDDTSHRLYVSYFWGVPDEKGRTNMWAAKCFNETNCLGDFNTVERFENMIFELASVAKSMRIRKGKPADPETYKPVLPGPLKRLTQLSTSHPAITYLAGREFDPEVLDKVYKVRYCVNSMYRFAAERIVTLFYSRGKLWGWQARVPGELDWKGPKKHTLPPKYFGQPSMQKSKHLYNIGNASQFRTGVVVEGVTDVWKFGAMAMPLLGSSISDHQWRILKSAFGDGSLVLLLDPDVMVKLEDPEQRKKVIGERARWFKHGIALVKLEKGADPGSLNRDFLRDYVMQEAEKQRVRVSWSRK